MISCNPQDLLGAASCFMCLPGGQLKVVEVSLLAQLLKVQNPMAAIDPQSLLSAASCFVTLTPFELAAVEVQLLCELLQSGGSNVAACLVSQSGGPTAACPYAFGLGYDNDPNSATAGQFWYWDITDQTWVKFIQ